ncbi:DUF4158 domain-containing protein [Saccharopolyspora sp. ASAGF58]|uniref:DUF4158 domain-containing protein n=1 Tax=Saccharopolyspora sp. ASAGF58 TaxID=2719023 RepID=UPI0035301C2E
MGSISGSRKTKYAGSGTRRIFAVGVPGSVAASHLVGRTRLGFVLILKCFEIKGRFPTYLEEIPPAAVEFLAEQLQVAPEALRVPVSTGPLRLVARYLAWRRPSTFRRNSRRKVRRRSGNVSKRSLSHRLTAWP